MRKAVMERPNGLAELMLVSKYYPVANYSYPRQELAPTPHNSRRSSKSSGDASSLGSESTSLPSSPPGLVDDRTDSEVSGDDDYQYHAVAEELWDTFWKPGQDGKKHVASRPAASTGQFPELMPSPQPSMRRRPNGSRSQPSEAWPLPEAHTRQRKTSPTYSPFPKPTIIPARPTSRQGAASPSCENGFLAPPPQQRHKPSALQFSRPSDHPRGPRPQDISVQRPATSHGTQPNSPTDNREHRPKGRSPPLSHSIYSVASLSATHLPLHPSNNNTNNNTHQHLPRPPQVLRPYKSTAQLYVSRPPEPQSVFEDDSDDDDNDRSSLAQSPTLAFFRFHRRGEAEPNNSNNNNNNTRQESSGKATLQKPWVEVTAAAAAAKDRRQLRKRTSLSVLVPPLRQGDVISRMLGRRSR